MNYWKEVLFAPPDGEWYHTYNNNGGKEEMAFYGNGHWVNRDGHVVHPSHWATIQDKNADR
jgi:hypothetical protein